MNHIFYYLLTHLMELKQRAYLARFLVKIEVSPDVEGDQDIVQLYEQVNHSDHQYFTWNAYFAPFSTID